MHFAKDVLILRFSKHKMGYNKLKEGGETHFINMKDVCYIESVDNLTFLYTDKLVFESKEKLYFFEERLLNTSFLRISKNTLLNMDYLKSVSVLPNYKLEAKLLNLEKLVINRHYTKNIKAYLNI
ncbi:LytTR family DNA-binding domain-containing protein [Aerococcus urinaeequi]|uniref:LytTR family DNA-binding domain-containing protein n=1 Tax=Aerococcus urinaeequi TaxID=51665 RepID=UPI003AABBAF2